MSHLIASHLSTLHTESKIRLQALERSSASTSPRTRNHSILSAKTKTKEPQIPKPKLFSTLAKEVSHSAGSTSQYDGSYHPALPSVAECAVHLEMLEVFFALRTRIIGSQELDKAFGFKEDTKTVYRKEYDYKQRKYVNKPHTIKDATWQTRRREKWIVYLHIAVGRFMAWAKAADVEIFLTSRHSPNFELSYLPPCDVLMVWHAFLLNPKDYEEYCTTRELQWLYKAPFPWNKVHEAIDHHNLSYILSPECSHWAKTKTHMAPYLNDFLAQISQKEGSISDCLSQYGATRIEDAWRYRPELHPTSSDLAFDLHRGFIDCFQEASNSAYQARLLVANVQRQASFVDKMHQHLWLRSPAVAGTLQRAIDRYDGFLQLFKLYPGRTLVPTLDIDLVWHTHQLSPERYKLDVKERAGRFINHDDKIVQGKLDVGLENTRELFRVRFGEKYDVCLCWDCEALVQVVEKYDEKDALDTTDVQKWVEEAQGEVDYYRTVELARRKG